MIPREKDELLLEALARIDEGYSQRRAAAISGLSLGAIQRAYAEVKKLEEVEQ